MKQHFRGKPSLQNNDAPIDPGLEVLLCLCRGCRIATQLMILVLIMWVCVQGLLVREPASRLTANQALEHPWIKDQRSAPSKSLNGSVVRLYTSASQVSVLAHLRRLGVCACNQSEPAKRPVQAPQWQRGQDRHSSVTSGSATWLPGPCVPLMCVVLL